MKYTIYQGFKNQKVFIGTLEINQYPLGTLVENVVLDSNLNPDLVLHLSREEPEPFSKVIPKSVKVDVLLRADKLETHLL